MHNVILGGGISGLSAAFYLSKSSGNGIKIIESSQRLGGWIKTNRVNGTIFEQGPRTLRCNGIAAQNTLRLVKEIGLASSIRSVPKTSEAAKIRMIYFKNQLITLPHSWTALFKTNTPFIKPFFHAIINDLSTPGKSVTDESIHDFVSRRFGKEYAEVLFSAMICGIFAGDAREISVRALMNNLFEKEQKHGSVCRGLVSSLRMKPDRKHTRSVESKNWSVWSLENGLETLPNKLEEYLREQKNVEIKLRKKCTKVEFKHDKVFVTVDGNVEMTDHLYSSLPSKNLADILGEEHSYLKRELSAIPFVSVAVVNLEYPEDLLERKGFGFLVPPSQNLPILGVIYDSCIFPQDEKTVLTVMMGGKWFNHYFGPNPNEEFLLQTAQDNVRNILNINENPTNSLVTVLRDCIPQYVVGHSERLTKIRDYIKNNKLPMSLLGNSFDGVGVSDAILSAKTAVEDNLKIN